MNDTTRRMSKRSASTELEAVHTKYNKALKEYTTNPTPENKEAFELANKEAAETRQVYESAIRRLSLRG